MDVPPLPPQFQSADLADEVQRRCQWLVNDCMTVLRARWEHPDWFEAHSSSKERPNGLGGGNYLMALGLFTALNLLAKVHLFLVNPAAFCKKAKYLKTEETKQYVFNNLDDALKSSVKNNWRERRVGECDETTAFTELIKAFQKEKHYIGVPENQEANIWRAFRNQLAHMAETENYVGITKRPEGYELDSPAELERHIRREYVSFYLRPRELKYVCNVDRFIYDILDIADWLVGKLEAARDTEGYRLAENWLYQREEYEEVEAPPKGDGTPAIVTAIEYVELN